MKITRWGELGILCAVFMASRINDGQKTVTANDIAPELNIDVDHTRQILQRLKKAGLVSTIRGPQGGYKLTRSAVDITLLEILVATEGATFEVVCESKPVKPSSDGCGNNGTCGLRSLWVELREHIDWFLTRVTVQDILDRELSSQSVPTQNLIEFPRISN